MAREILKDLQLDYNVQYDEKDAIGKRYRRMDAVGTPLCITIDHQSLEDKTVTIRHRDSMKQERVNASDLKAILDKSVNMSTLLKTL
jgi:glycyl-tRNA synthetase